MTKIKITPMIQQYLEINGQYPDTLLFYRMGDFYELFFEDAVEAARILGITLTARDNKGDAGKISMCGVPCHSSSTYLAKLIKAGRRVAICEQMGDPAPSKGLVHREVVRVVSPGLAVDDQLLDDQENRFLAAVCHRDQLWGLSLVDLSTGEFMVGEFSQEIELLDELSRMSPAEILLAPESTTKPQKPTANQGQAMPHTNSAPNPGAGVRPRSCANAGANPAADSAALQLHFPHCCYGGDERNRQHPQQRHAPKPGDFG